MATVKGNSRNETWHRTKDEIGVAVQNWLVRASEGNSMVVVWNPTQVNFL